MRTAFSLKVLMLLLLASFTSQSQVSTIFNDAKFNDSLASIQEKLSAISKDIRIVEIAQPNFPLSKKTEEHLIASMVEVEHGIIDKVVFTFSDDKLSYIQAKGNVVKGLTTNIKSEAKTYIGYQVYRSDLLFIDKKNDAAWLLTPESVHLNLFTWDNPYLNSNHKAQITYNSTVKIPSFIKMGGEIDTLTPLLQENSSFIYAEKLEGTDTVTKNQINCFGVEYAGFPRKFEARFENGKLNMLWILTGKGEENRIREKLTEEYGNAIATNDSWEVFNNWTVLLRKDKPEILLLSKELGLVYKKQYSE